MSSTSTNRTPTWKFSEGRSASTSTIGELARLEQFVFVPVKLNTATDEDILTIPGLGNRMLREFKEYRPYTVIAQFDREIGKYVDDGEVARLRRYVAVD